MAAPIDCPNYEVNLEMCPCPNMECGNRGICCLCAANHMAIGGKTFCMRGTERPAETMSMKGIAVGTCSQRAANEERCSCSYSSCDNHGMCCDCMRNHWGNTTYPAPACMR